MKLVMFSHNLIGRKFQSLLEDGSSILPDGIYNFVSWEIITIIPKLSLKCQDIRNWVSNTVLYNDFLKHVKFPILILKIKWKFL